MVGIQRKEPSDGRGRLIALVFGALVWTAASGLGFAKLWQYSTTPGGFGNVPEHWPAVSSIARSGGQPTLVVVLHPHCPCSRATLRELALVMAQARGRLAAYVVFVNPTGAAGWATTDLWDLAAAIPGVQLIRDDGDVEAITFGAETSGQALLYGIDGQLLFRGGITPARGHSGDNPGRTAILQILDRGTTDRRESLVFGCHLRDAK